MSNRILVTGSAGFLGYNTALSLKREGLSVCGVDLPAREGLAYDRQGLLRNAGVKTKDLDLLQPDALSITLDEWQPSHLIHFAALSEVRASCTNARLYFKTNVDLFLSVLEACAIRGISLVYASSATAASPITSIYGATKRADEALAEAYAHLHELSITGLRYFTVYGPWGRPDMAYYKFLEALLNNEPVMLHGDGTTARDFVYIDDAVRATRLALTLPKGHRVIDVGVGESITLLELIETLERHTGTKANIRNKPAKPWDLPLTRANPETASRILDFSPEITFDEGMARFVRWHASYSAAYGRYFPKTR